MKHLLLFIIPVMVTIFTTGCGEKRKIVTGSFSEKGENGINIFEFNAKNGTMKMVSSFNAGPNPSYLCLSENEKLIYAINEVSEFNGVKGGGITTVRYSNDFENLTIAGELPVPNGGPCFISISPDKRFLLVANYGGGSVTVVKLGENGIPVAITDNIIYSDTILYREKNVKISHAHMIDFDPAGEKVYVTDLGLDRIMIYTLDRSAGKLMPFIEKGVAVAPFTGPRHFVFNTTGTMMYVMGEINSAISVFSVGGPLGLREVQTISTLRPGYTGKNSGADIHISPTGKFIYVTNRGENSVAAFSIGTDGLLTLSGHSSCGGNWPRNFAIDPSGRFLLAANQKSDNIAVFKIDSETGLPADSIGNVVIIAPACIKFPEN
jgi:6-phosphogluconolactonase